jgi:hypothetical protein
MFKKADIPGWYTFTPKISEELTDKLEEKGIPHKVESGELYVRKSYRRMVESAYWGLMFENIRAFRKKVDDSLYVSPESLNRKVMASA